MSRTNVTNSVKLLAKNGELINSGFTKKPVMPFNKEVISKKNRIKEWDNYVIQDDRFFVDLTILNMSYLAEIRISVIDLNHGFVYKRTSRLFNPQNSVLMASDFRKGVSDCKTKDAWVRFENHAGQRILKGYFKNFYKSKTYTGDLEFEFKIHKEPDESIVSANNFKDKKHFIYSQKINDLEADGSIIVNGKMYTFDKDLTFSNCLIARGVMPYSSRWEISTVNARDKDGNMVAFNLGRILGKGDKVEENIVFYDGKIEKISDIKVYNNKNGFKQNAMNTWTFYSDDGKLELFFEPILSVKQGVNWVVVRNKTNLILGSYTGKITLDNGKEIEIEKVMGFSETVKNKW